MKRLLAFSAALAACAAVPAQAAITVNAGDAGTTTLTNTGDSTSFTFDGQVPNGPVIPGLGAILTLTFTSVTSVNGNTVFDILYSLENTSTLAGTRVSAFGFNTDPNTVSASITGTPYDAVQVNGQFPGNTIVDLCFYDAPNGKGGNCTGGGGGVAFGATGSGHLLLTFAGAVSNISMSDFINRYQAFNYNGISSAIGTPVGVPEPASWMLMILGIGFAGAVMRRQRQSVRAKINFA